MIQRLTASPTTELKSEETKSSPVSISIGNNLFLVASSGKVTRCHQTLEGNGKISYLPDSVIYQVDEAKATKFSFDLPKSYETLKFFPYDTQRVLLLAVDASRHLCDVFLIHHANMECSKTPTLDTNTLLTTATLTQDLTDVQIQDIVLVNREILYFLVSDLEFPGRYSHYVFEFNLSEQDKTLTLTFEKSSYIKGLSCTPSARLWHPMLGTRDLVIHRCWSTIDETTVELRSYLHPEVHNEELVAGNILSLRVHVDSITILPFGFIGYLDVSPDRLDFVYVTNLAEDKKIVLAAIYKDDKISFIKIQGHYFLEIISATTSQVRKIPINELNKLLLPTTGAEEKIAVGIQPRSLIQSDWTPINLEQSRFVKIDNEITLIDIGDENIATPALQTPAFAASRYYKVGVPFGLSYIDILPIGNDTFIINFIKLKLIARGKLVIKDGKAEILVDLSVLPVSHRMTYQCLVRYDDQTILAFPQGDRRDGEVYQINIATLELRKIHKPSLPFHIFHAFVSPNKEINLYSYDHELMIFKLDSSGLILQNRLKFKLTDAHQIHQIRSSSCDNSLIVHAKTRDKSDILYHIKIRGNELEIRPLETWQSTNTCVLPNGTVIFVGHWRNLCVYDPLTLSTSKLTEGLTDTFFIRETRTHHELIFVSKDHLSRLKLNIEPRLFHKELKRESHFKPRLFDAKYPPQATEIKTKASELKTFASKPSLTQEPFFQFESAEPDIAEENILLDFSRVHAESFSYYSQPWIPCDKTYSCFVNYSNRNVIGFLDLRTTSPTVIFHEFIPPCKNIMPINENQVLVLTNDNELLYFKINSRLSKFEEKRHSFPVYFKSAIPVNFIGRLANTVLLTYADMIGNQINIYFFDAQENHLGILSSYLFSGQNAEIQSVDFSHYNNVVHVICIKEDRNYLLEFVVDCDEVTLKRTNEFNLPLQKAVKCWQPTIQDHIIIAHETKIESVCNLVLYQKIGNKLLIRHILGTIKTIDFNHVHILPLGQVIINGILIKLETGQCHLYKKDEHHEVVFVRLANSHKECQFGIRSRNSTPTPVSASEYKFDDSYQHQQAYEFLALYKVLCDELRFFSLDLVRLAFSYVRFDEPARAVCILPSREACEADVLQTIENYIEKLKTAINSFNPEAKRHPGDATLDDYCIPFKILKRIKIIIPLFPAKTYRECYLAATFNLDRPSQSKAQLINEVINFLNLLENRIRPYHGTDYQIMDDQRPQEIVARRTLS